jgi:hypothetical protein
MQSALNTKGTSTSGKTSPSKAGSTSSSSSTLTTVLVGSAVSQTNWSEAVTGSTKPVIQAFLWKSGKLIQELNVADASVNFDSSQDVRATAELVITDPDGTLAPTNMGSPLTPFGSRIQIIAGFDVGSDRMMVSLGWFVIWDMTIDEAWQSYKFSDGSSSDVRKGAVMRLQLRDLMQLVVDYKFLAPATSFKADAWSEIVYLLKGVLPYSVPSWYTPTNTLTAVTYSESRMEAIKGWAAKLNAEPIIDTYGNFTLALKNPTQTVTPTLFAWDVNLTQYTKSLTRDGVYNIVVAKGKDTSGNNIIAYSTLKDGPTAWNGPFGPRPIIYQNDSLNNQTALQAWADSLLATAKTQNTQTIEVSCLPNPAIELGDYATLKLRGSTKTMTGRVIKFTYRARGVMDVTLALPNGWMG